MIGNFVLVLGDEEAKGYLLDSDAWVNRFMTDLATDIAEHAETLLHSFAPGRIGVELVDLDPAHMMEPGVVEATAGVTADASEEVFSGSTSNSADFPVFVEVGTGVYGEFHRAIVMPPGRVMVFDWANERVRTPYISGQKPQRYAERSYEETLGWVPARLARADILPEGGT